MNPEVKTVYLSVSEGTRIQSDSLEDALIAHPEIKTVVLFWAWTQDLYTSNASVFEGYVSVNTIDEEYCFFGNREKALQFASRYDCWDGADFMILKGDILYGYTEDTDMQTSWSDGYDHVGGISPGYDPTWFSWLRVDFDYEKGIEYVLTPDPLPEVKG